MKIDNSSEFKICGKSCIVKGDGEPLVFLHGFMSSKEAFIRQIDCFSCYFRIYAPDLSGFGKSEMPYPYRLDDYVEELNALAAYTGGKINLVAHSFGCRIALKTSANSQIINKMVLCGVAGLKPRFFLKRTFKRSAYKILCPIMGKEKAEKIFASPDYLMTSGNLRESFKLVTSEYCDGYIEKISCPTLCVFGENDKETPSYLLKRIKRKNQAIDGVIMKGCGHFCFVEKPTEFNSILAEFLL